MAKCVLCGEKISAIFTVCRKCHDFRLGFADFPELRFEVGTVV